MNSIITKVTLAFLLCCATVSGFCQELELSSIMQGDDFVGQQPHSETWKHDSKGFYFEWDNSDNYQTYYECDLGGSPKQIETSELHKHDIKGYYNSF